MKKEIYILISKMENIRELIYKKYTIDEQAEYFFSEFNILKSIYKKFFYKNIIGLRDEYFTVKYYYINKENIDMLYNNFYKMDIESLYYRLKEDDVLYLNNHIIKKSSFMIAMNRILIDEKKN